MEQKLYDAAHTGNVQILHELMQENDDFLEKVPSPGSVKIPLHIAVLFGQVDFVKELLELSATSMMQLNQLNQDGYTPLHLASANGDVDMVKLLLVFGKKHSVFNEMCLKRDTNGRNPTHCAAIRGGITVLDELCAACPKSALELTFSQRESILHLAVRNNQCEAFLFLAQDPNTKNLLNLTDHQGNTLLHLAASRKQIQIIEVLVSKPSLKDVNAINTYGLTAILDILITDPLQSNGFEIEEIIQLAGGKRSKHLPPILTQLAEIHEIQVQVSASTGPISNAAPSNQSLSRSSTKELMESPRYEDWMKEMRGAILVMASLVATVAFEAALNSPGPGKPSDNKTLQRSYDKVRGKYSWLPLAS